MNNSPEREPRHLYLFGDSIAAGLGLRPDEPSYGVIVADSLNLELVDLSATAQMIHESRRKAESFQTAGALAVVAHGITESIPRPTPQALRFVPPRWRRAGWLDPRPFHSPRLFRQALTRTESAIRWRVKVRLMRAKGARCFVSPESYGAELDMLASFLVGQGCRVIVLGQPDRCERYFPGSSASQVLYMRAASRRPDVILRGRLDLWGDYVEDHLHLNASGHRRVADEILSTLTAPPDISVSSSVPESCRSGTDEGEARDDD